MAALPADAIRFYASRKHVSFPEAHRYLQQCRGRNRAGMDKWSHEILTDAQDFDWRAWVCQRPDAEHLVGPGVHSFLFVWVEAVDTNLHEKRGSRSRSSSPRRW